MALANTDASYYDRIKKVTLKPSFPNSDQLSPLDVTQPVDNEGNYVDSSSQFFGKEVPSDWGGLAFESVKGMDDSSSEEKTTTSLL